MSTKVWPTTVSELYPRLWLKPEDLKGKAVTVTIAKYAIEEFRQPNGETRQALVLAFEKASKRLICNKTQVLAIAAMFGENFADWLGRAITLAPGTANNGKPTIVIQ